MLLLCNDRLALLRLQHAEQSRQEAAGLAMASRCGAVHEKQAVGGDYQRRLSKIILHFKYSCTVSEGQ